MSENRKLPPTLKVGITLQQRDNRYHVWSGTHGYYQRPETYYKPYQTDNQRAMSTYNQADLRASVDICRAMATANKSQVAPKTNLAALASAPRPVVLTRSVSADCFVDFVKKKNEAWRTASNADDYRLAFERIAAAAAAKLNQSNDGDELYISMKEVPTVVNAVLGEDVPRFVMEKFVVLCKKAEAGGRVYWADFARLAPRAVLAAAADCSLKKELPPLVMLMTKPRIIDPNLGPVGQFSSTYKDTYCVSQQELLQPASSMTLLPPSNNNTINNMNNNNEDFDPHATSSPPSSSSSSMIKVSKQRDMLNPAAKVLCAGTTKGTLQIPGYCGHMPMNIRNPRKHFHSDGSYLHPVVNSLRLTKKGGNSVLGYAGHQPWHAESERERLNGQDPLTSTGAAYGPERRML